MVLIRPATLADVDVLTEYNLKMAKETEGKDLPGDVVSQGVRTVLLGQAAALYFVAELAGTVVGQCMVTKEWSDWRSRDVWWFQSVYVHPDHRNQGIFKRLYQHVKAEAQQAGAAGLRLYADDGNATAHATYERLGMTSHYKVFEDMFTSY